MNTEDNAQFHIVLVKGWIRKGDNFLLAKRSLNEIQSPGTWALPGGKVENIDSKNILFNTLRKELIEEVNIEIGNEIDLIYNNSFTRDDKAHVIGLTFICNYEAGDAKPLDETTEIKWFTLSELIEMKGIKPFLKIEIEHLFKYLNK